jgi:hypothetical protein
MIGITLMRRRPTAWCSAAASAPNECTKNPPISRAKRSAATPCSALRSPSFGLRVACADHTLLVPHRHTERLVGTTHIWDHARHNELPSESHPSGITLPTTGNPHDGLPYHTRHHEHSAPRACVPRLHNGRLHAARRTQSAFQNRGCLIHHKWVAAHAPRTPNGMPISRRERASTSV